MTDLQEYKKYLLECFPNSWFNENNEFIAHTKSNTYFNKVDEEVVAWMPFPDPYTESVES